MSYDIERVAESLLGTDRNLDDVVGSHLTDDWQFCDELRAHAIRCPGCAYWFDPEEVSEDDECEGCCDA